MSPKPSEESTTAVVLPNTNMSTNSDTPLKESGINVSAIVQHAPVSQKEVETKEHKALNETEKDPKSLSLSISPDQPDLRSAAAETSGSELAKTATAFVVELQGWKNVFPADLLETMENLEQQLRGFCSPSPIDHTMPAPPSPSSLSPPDVACELIRSTMQDWRKRGPWALLPPPPPPFDPSEAAKPKQPNPAIELFYHDRRNVQDSMEHNIPSRSRFVSKRRQNEPDPLFRDNNNLQRIVINDFSIRNELELISELSCTEYGTIVMTPPYKLLTFYAGDMKDRIEELENELLLIESHEARNRSQSDNMSHTRDGSNSDDVSASLNAKNLGDEPGEEYSESTVELSVESTRRALSGLQTLCDIIQEDLKPTLELRENIGKVALKSIAFEDLCHLFKPGDTVCSTEMGKEQLYRVYHVSGGQVLRRALTTNDYHMGQPMNNQSMTGIPPPPPPPPPPSVQPLLEEEFEVNEAYGHLSQNRSSDVGTWTEITLDCYRVAFDGARYGPINKKKIIRPYVGHREINKLSVYPVRFHVDQEDLLARMKKRGLAFVDSFGHRSYEGPSMARAGVEAGEDIESDVYIDFEESIRNSIIARPELGWLSRTMADQREYEELIVHTHWKLFGEAVDVQLTEHFFADNRKNLLPLKAEDMKSSPELLCLCPSFVPGYVFRTRRWAYLDVDILRKVNDGPEAAQSSGFNELVINDTYREMLVALVHDHASGLERKKTKLKGGAKRAARTQIDIVRGKGLGLIILLHGAPGTGKTSTAETIAAYTRRPLYSITCGDLGTNPDEVEKRLEVHTKRADRWGCVLLIDEADVFLMQRDKRDVDRNALVSVFLRHLEYYSGILFLTTNRVGSIDEAFKSRIHVSLYYPNIDLDGTKKMWGNILDRLERENKTSEYEVKFDRKLLLKFAENHYKKHKRQNTTWNGRQIRNAFQTALALAKYERQKEDEKAEQERLEEEKQAKSKDPQTSDGKKKKKKKQRPLRLTKKIFEEIAETAQEFERYIETVRGKDGENAFNDRLRNDFMHALDTALSKQPENAPRSKNHRDATVTKARKERAKPKKKKDESSEGEDTGEDEQDKDYDDEEDEEEEDEDEDDKSDEE